MGINAQFDFAREFPSSAWQYAPGQANARDWIDTGSDAFRDVVGINGIGGLIDELLNLKKKPIGFRNR